MQDIVSVVDLVKRYGSMIALDHFTMKIERGEIFGLLGPNGSGKTTAINCILSCLPTTAGRFGLFGQPMTQSSYDLKRKIGIRSAKRRRIRGTQRAREHRLLLWAIRE